MEARTWRYEVPARRGELRKRSFDFCLSAVLLLIVLPVMALAAILLSFDRLGPIFSREPRIGLHGRQFALLKFRTSIPNGIAQRIGVGSLLNRLCIDELPQLINVLKGDMSFVGPRPERPDVVNKLSRRSADYHWRHSIKPGLTGWAQLQRWHRSLGADARQRLRYDLEYINNHTLFFDLRVLTQTLRNALLGGGPH